MCYDFILTTKSLILIYVTNVNHFYTVFMKFIKVNPVDRSDKLSWKINTGKHECCTTGNLNLIFNHISVLKDFTIAVLIILP